MSVIDELNKLGDETYGNMLDRGQEQLQTIQHRGYNPFDDLAGAVAEWVGEAEKAGERVAKAAGEVYANDSSMAVLDDMSLPSPNPVLDSDTKLAIALTDAIEEARYDVTKDPLSIAGDVGGAVAPWIPLAIQLPIMLKEANKMTDSGKSAGETASNLGLPMVAGTVAASLSHTVGGKLAKAAPLASKVLTTPFVGSTMAAGGTLAASPEMREFASEHPARFAVNMFTTDTAIGAKKLATPSVGNKTHIDTPFMQKVDRLLSANENAVRSTDVSTDTGILRNKLEGESTEINENGVLANKDVGETTKEIQPITTKESMPVTAREEAFPEERPDVKHAQDLLAQKTADEILEAKRIPEVQQGAYDDELIPSTDNLYPTSVSINQIWETFKRLVPIRPNNMKEERPTTLGYFHTVGRGIRVRGFRAWSTMCHELGHAASKKLGFARGERIEAELADGANSIWQSGEYGDIDTPDGFKTYVEEGRAAFMNEYLINPELAKKHFPLTFVAFEETVKKDPVWEANIKTIGQQVRRWCNMNIAQKASGSKQWGDVDNTSIAQKIQKARAGVEKAYADEFADLRAIKEVYEDISGKDVRIENDPSAVAQDAKQSINATEACLFDGNGFSTDEIIQQIATKYQVALHSVVATDIFLPFKVGGERGKELEAWLKKQGLKDWYEAWTNYQVAKHELELIKVKNAERLEKLSATLNKLDEAVTAQKEVVAKATEAHTKASEAYNPIKERLDNLKKRHKVATAGLTEINSSLVSTQRRIKQLQHIIEKTQNQHVNSTDKVKTTLNKLKTQITHKVKQDRWLKGNLDKIDNYRQLLYDYQNKLLDKETLLSKALKELDFEREKLASYQEQKGKYEEALKDNLVSIKLLEVKEAPTLKEMQNAIKHLKKQQAKLDRLEKRRAKEWAEKGSKILNIKAGLDDYLTSMTREQNEEIVKWEEDIPELKRASDLWKKWHENNLRIAVAGGILKEKTMKEWLATYPEYIPLKRDFTIEGKDTMSGDIRHLLSEEGSDRVVSDPFVQAVLDMKTIVSKVERNRINLAVANLSHKDFGHYLMMEVKENKSAEAHRIITVYEKGVPHYYQCMADGLYEALTSTNKSFVKMNVDVLTKTQQRMADILRVGATGTPAFAMWNLCRDIVDATVLNADGRGDKAIMLHQPVSLFLDGMSVVLSQQKWMEKIAKTKDARGGTTEHMDALLANRRLKAEYMAGGVQYTTMLSDKRGLNRNFRRIVSPETKWQKAGRIIYSPIKTLTDFNEACEQVARMGIYKRVRERGGTAFEARYHAADSTVNFMRSGTKTKEINKVTPFFNATIQGTLKIEKAIRQDPYGVAMACFQCITLPTLFCYAFNRDEDWYRDMPLEQKNKAWYLKLPDGNIHVFPKPQFLGQIFGSLPERILDVAMESEDREAVISCLEEAVKGLLPLQTTPVTTKFYEWQANKNFYTGRPIVDQRLGKVSPKYQYDVYTSEIAKKLGSATDLSPKKIDNTIYGLTSSMGYFFTGATDYMLKDNQTPDKKWQELTRFTYAEGGRQTRSQDVFFKNLDKLEVQTNDAKLDGKPLKDDKTLKGMQESKQLAALVTNGTKAKTPKKLLRKLGKMANDPDVKRGIRAIENDKELDGETKRAKIDKLVKVRNNIYRNANKKYLNYKYIQSPE